MPLTLRTTLLMGGVPAGGSGLMASGLMTSGLTIRAIARRQLLLRRILRGGGLYQRLDDLFIGLHPVGGELPLLAVPGVDAGPRRAHVVDAGRADRPHHAREAECVELELREVEV